LTKSTRFLNWPDFSEVSIPGACGGRVFIIVAYHM
jgi:hypothetical protein